MLKTQEELLAELGEAIRVRRIAIGWSQAEAAERAGVPYRSWRRLETGSKGSINHLVRAALALRCEDNLAQLFPAPPATSMDELLAQQAAAKPRTRRRVSRSRPPPP